MGFDLSAALEAQQQKAIFAHPALMQNSPTSVYAPGAGRQKAKLTQREAVNHLDAYGGLQAIDHVMNAVDLYAGSAAGAAWRLENEDGTRLVKTKTDHTPSDSKVGPEDLYELLRKPNPFMMYDELVSHLVIDLLLVGNGYWYKWRNNKEGKPLAMYRLSPSHVKIIPGAFGPERYEYQPPGARDPLKIALKDMVHFKLPNPHDHYYGMGVVRKGGRAMDLELAVVDTMSSYYENQAQPSLIVQSERRVPRDVFNKLRAQLRARVSGSRNAGELLVLEAGLKAETLDRSASDSLFKEISGVSMQRIYAMFRTSPKLFGYTGQDTGTDKVSDARREFDTYVMRPFLDQLQARITEYVTAPWDITFKIDYNYVIPQDELLKNVGAVAAVPGIKVRELRRALLPLGFMDGESTGDEAIDDEILNMPMPALDENGAGGGPNRNLPGQAGRPPTGANVPTFKSGATRTKPATRSPGSKALTDEERAAVAAENLAKALQTVAAGEKKALTQPENEHTSIGRKLDHEQRPNDPNAGSRAQTVDEVAAFIQAGVAREVVMLERALLDHVEGKAFTKKDVVSRIRKSEAWKAFREGVERVLKDAGYRALQGSVMDQAESGRIPDEDLDYDAIVSSVIHRKDGLPSIVRTMRNRIAAKIANLGPDATERDANALIQEHIADFKTGQAETIALAEAVELYNEGTLQVAEATGATEVFVIEEDDAPDRPCLDAKDSVWTIDHARDHRKEHPRCRRAFVPLGAIS